MAFAQGSRSGIGFILESSYGITPSTPHFADIPRGQNTLDLSVSSLESADIRSDRQTAVYRHGNKQISGDIVVDFRDADYDTLLKMAMFNAWSTSTLTVGTTSYSASIEDQQLDIGQYRLFTGCMITSMKMSIKPNAMISTTFSFAGSDMAIASSSASSIPLVAGAGFSPYDSYTGSILENNSTLGVITDLEFTIDNSVRPTFIIGQNTTPYMEYGRAKITGSLQAYFSNAILMNKFINETITTISCTLYDGTSGHHYTFLFPQVKYSTLKSPVSTEQSRMLTMDFIALRDPSTGTELKITHN
jgi:hypothetical protein